MNVANSGDREHRDEDGDREDRRWDPYDWGSLVHELAGINRRGTDARNHTRRR